LFLNTRFLFYLFFCFSIAHFSNKMPKLFGILKKEKLTFINFSLKKNDKIFSDAEIFSEKYQSHLTRLKLSRIM